MSFVFYDTETTGIQKSFDQILQFAAIRTDEDFNEIERFELRCRIHPHIAPSAGALRVTKMTIGKITDPALPCHYDMVCEIAEKLKSWSPSIFAGWNTMDFDEHLLRQALYQCLHRPYITNTDGNCRLDVLKIAQLCSILLPEALAIPINEKGKPVFKLDQLAPLNGFSHVNAHDAMGDVEATIHIAKLIKENAAEIWSNAVRLSKKASVIDYIDDEPAFLVSEFYFNKPYQFAVTKVGVDPQNSGVVLALDLTANLVELASLDPGALTARLHRSPKLMRRVKTNACPNIQALEDEGWAGLSMLELYSKAEDIKADGDFCERLVTAFMAGAEPHAESEFVEENIYAAFSGDDDLKRMDQFHSLPWDSRLPVVEAFEDARLRELGLRLIFLNSPISLGNEHHSKQAKFLAARLLGHGYTKPQWLTLTTASEEAGAMRASCDQEELAILDELEAYLQTRIQEAKAILGI